LPPGSIRKISHCQFIQAAPLRLFVPCFKPGACGKSYPHAPKKKPANRVQAGFDGAM
jgi:hypothetical protein